MVRAGQRIQLQVDGEVVTIHAVSADGGRWLATHPRATARGSWVVDHAHWDGLPDGHTRAVTVETPGPDRSWFAPERSRADAQLLPNATSEPRPFAALLAAHHAAAAPVARRPLADYQTAALTPTDDRK
jgi:hypothetical protein